MKKKLQYNKGEMHLGVEVLLFILAIFVIWVLTGGSKNETAKKPFIKPLIDQTDPGKVYGPGEK